MVSEAGTSRARESILMEARTFRIAAIPGDGIGAEVIAAGRAVLNAVAGSSGGALAVEWEEFPWGCGYYERTGQMMAADALFLSVTGRSKARRRLPTPASHALPPATGTP